MAQRFISRTARYVLGDDVFVSYARADGASYAARLASELTRRGFSCRFDQWASRPNVRVPPELLTALSRSTVLVVVSTAGAGVSGPVATEIEAFLKTGRTIVPVDLDGTIRTARWWPSLDGLAVSNAEPFDAAVERIENSVDFGKRNARLRRVAAAALVVVLALAGLSVWAGWRAGDATAFAAQETARAAKATEDRIKADGSAQQARALAVKEGEAARTASAIAAKERATAVNAEARRRAAENEARNQESLAADATKRREAADRLREQAEAALNSTTKKLDEESRIADSRERARLVGGIVDRGRALTAAIDAYSVAPTDAAVAALKSAITRAMFRDDELPPAHADPTGTFAAIAGRQGTGVLLDTATGKETAICGAPQPITDLAFSPSGKWLLVGRDPDWIGAGPRMRGFELWDTGRGVPVQAIDVERGSVFSSVAQWAPDSSMFLVQIDAQTLQQVTVEQSGKMAVSRHRIPFDSRVVFGDVPKRFLTHTGPGDWSTIALWDFDVKQLWSITVRNFQWVQLRRSDRRLLIAHQQPSNNSMADVFTEVRLDADGRPAGTSTIERRAFDFRTITGEVPPEQQDPFSALVPINDPLVARTCRNAALAPDGSRAVCFGNQSGALFFDVRTQTSVSPLSELPEIGPYSFSRDGSRFAISTLGLSVWSVPEAKRLWAEATNLAPLQFSANGSRLLVGIGSPGGSFPVDLSVLDAQTGKRVSGLPDVGSLLWLSSDMARAITRAGTTEMPAARLLVWDVDRGAVTNTVDIGAREEADNKHDQALLSRSDTGPELLEIATRRLRACTAPAR